MSKGAATPDVKAQTDGGSEKQRVLAEMDKMSDQQLHKEAEKVIDSTAQLPVSLIHYRAG